MSAPDPNCRRSRQDTSPTSCDTASVATRPQRVGGWLGHLPHSRRLDDLATHIDADDRALAVLLTGSWAHDMATEHSDIDLLVILARDSLSWRRDVRDGVDVQTMTLERLRHVPDDPGRWWDRYTFCRTRTLLDRSDGHVDALLQRWCCLSPNEVLLALDFHLEAYLNYLYRSLKSHREGRMGLARLDASESLTWALSLAFAVHGRVRPVNKYVAWELEHDPIDEAGWSAPEFLALLDAILDTGDAGAQRALFGLIEPPARRLGYGGVIDGFSGLDLLRG